MKKQEEKTRADEAQSLCSLSQSSTTSASSPHSFQTNSHHLQGKVDRLLLRIQTQGPRLHADHHRKRLEHYLELRRHCQTSAGKKWLGSIIQELGASHYSRYVRKGFFFSNLLALCLTQGEKMKIGKKDRV